MRAKAGPYTRKFENWLAQAKKGEVFTYFEGDIRKIMMSPEARLSNAERASYKRERDKAKAAGRKPPPIPDPFKAIKPDVLALVEMVQHNEHRGLLAVRQIVQRPGRSLYEAECIVQRNGLSAVRQREWNVKS